MAAPTPTPRGIPAGARLTDGFKTLITLKLAPTIGFWETVVKPPGLDGGDPVNTTTMHNNVLRTMAPRYLRTMTPITTTAAYDPAALTAIQAAINRLDTITVTFSNRATVCFYGYLRSFEPADSSEGTMPDATITLQPTNQDPATGAEEGWVYTMPGTVMAASGEDELLGEHQAA